MNIETHRKMYDHEKWANDRMLGMLEGVPEGARGDVRFQRAVTLAGHLSACRENWLNWIRAEGGETQDWFPAECALADLRPRFAAIEQRWSDYLAGADDVEMARTFHFTEADGSTWSLVVGDQTIQLATHGPYHRGQVALLVDQLGGETVDTDYIYWVAGG